MAPLSDHAAPGRLRRRLNHPRGSSEPPGESDVSPAHQGSSTPPEKGIMDILFNDKSRAAVFRLFKPFMNKMDAITCQVHVAIDAHGDAYLAATERHMLRRCLASAAGLDVKGEPGERFPIPWECFTAPTEGRVLRMEGDQNRVTTYRADGSSGASKPTVNMDVADVIYRSVPAARYRIDPAAFLALVEAKGQASRDIHARLGAAQRDAWDRKRLPPSKRINTVGVPSSDVELHACGRLLFLARGVQVDGADKSEVRPPVAYCEALTSETSYIEVGLDLRYLVPALRVFRKAKAVDIAVHRPVDPIVITPSREGEERLRTPYDARRAPELTLVSPYAVDRSRKLMQAAFDATGLFPVTEAAS